MIYYPISALINAVASTIVCVVAITRNPKSPLNRSFGYFAFSVAAWSYCYFFWQIAQDAESALFWCRTLMAPAIFIPSTFFHFSMTFIHQYKKYSKLIVFWYAVSVIFLIADFTPLFIPDVRPRLDFPFWPTAGLLYTPFLAMFIGLTYYTHVLMFRSYKKSTGFEKNRIKYVFLGTAVGFIGGTTNYLLWYDIPVPPLGNALVAMYVIMVAYATIKYRFMDITVFTVRGLIAIVVYLLALGIPFWLGFKLIGGRGVWLIPVGLMAVLASSVPFIYNFLRHRAEAVLLKEQRRNQHNLLQISQGMTLIKDLDKLLRLIVHVVSRTIKIKEVYLFLLNKEINIYSVKASRYKSPVMAHIVFQPDDPIVKHLLKVKVPVVYEEIKARLHNDASLNEIEAKMRELKIAVVVPSFIREMLLGFLCLGQKTHGQMYTTDDLNVFSILANQAALAVENAVFYQETGKTLAEKFQEHRVWAIGKMGAGVGHQINNRFQTLTSNAEVIIEVYFPRLKKQFAEENTNGAFQEIEEALARIYDNSKRGGEIAKTLTGFSRKSDDFKPVDLEEAVKGALNLLSCKFPIEELNLSLDLPLEKPKILGNLSMMQDIFFNMLDNTHDAEVRKKSELGPYEVKTVIRGKPNFSCSHWEIEIEDNGIGMTEDEAKQVFIPFFTTKATSEKGTGLGLPMMHQMIEAHKGSIKVTSEFKVGTKIVLTLPIAS